MLRERTEMQFELSQMDLSELKKLKQDVEKAINTYQERALSAARQELEAQAQALGFSLEEIVQAKKVRTKIHPKYRNPNNSAETWTGRGRKPRWVITALQNGTDLKQLEI